MARWSNAANMVKLEDGDKVSIFGVIGTVSQVMLIRPENLPVDVLVSVLFRGQPIPNVFNLSEIEAVRFGGGWVNMKNEMVTV